MKKTYWSGFLTGVLCTILCITIGIGGQQFILKNRGQNSVYQKQEMEVHSKEDTRISPVNVLTKVAMLQKYIDTYYLNKVDGNKLEEGIYKGIVWGLADPYSIYYTKDEFKQIQESTSGVYCGIGVRVSQDANTGMLMIIEPFTGGPSAKAGILPGDIIYKVEDEKVTGKDISEVVAKIKGKEGTKVALTILRGREELEFRVERKEIETSTVSYEMLENKIGYIKISEFDEITAQQFREAMKELEKQDETGLIIDLRNNGGGRLTATVDMLDRMLPKGTLLTTKEKSGEGETFSSTDAEQFEKPLAVLINESSASASEVFAGAIQDYGTGKLVGTTSFGKGIVQTIFDLKDGTAIKLTTSEYFTPKGRNIHGKGLTPDVKIELNPDLKKKLILDKKEDTQLQAAIQEVIKMQK
ncbi:MAG: S41 family peptidase [Acetivibrio sp.]